MSSLVIFERKTRTKMARESEKLSSLCRECTTSHASKFNYYCNNSNKVVAVMVKIVCHLKGSFKDFEVNGASEN